MGGIERELFPAAVHRSGTVVQSRRNQPDQLGLDLRHIDECQIERVPLSLHESSSGTGTKPQRMGRLRHQLRLVHRQFGGNGVGGKPLQWAHRVSGGSQDCRRDGRPDECDLRSRDSLGFQPGGAAGLYPFDIFYAGNGAFTSIVDRNFPTTAELNAIGTIAKNSPTGFKSNNGTMWAWYAAAQSTFNTSATPNWSWPSAGGDCCPGGAHDWGFGIIPPRSKHTGGVHVALGDGSVRFVSDNIDTLTFQRLGHRSDGNPIGEF